MIARAGIARGGARANAARLARVREDDGRMMVFTWTRSARRYYRRRAAMSSAVRARRVGLMRMRVMVVREGRHGVGMVRKGEGVMRLETTKRDSRVNGTENSSPVRC